MNPPSRAVRVIWLIVGLFLLCLAGVAALLVHEFKREAESAVRQQVERMARSTETALNRQLIGVDLTLASLPRMPALLTEGARRIDKARAPELLRALIGQGLSARDLMLLDDQGRVIAAAEAATMRLGAGLPVDFLTQVQAQRAPQLAISMPVTSFNTGEKVVYLARSLGIVGGERLVVVAEVPVSALTTIMASAGRIEGLTLTLESESGTLLASVPAHDSLLGRRHPLPLLAGDAPGPARLAPGRLNDEQGYVSVRPTVYGSVLVSAGISEAATLARSSLARTNVAVFGLAFAVLAVLVGALAQTYLKRLASANAETAGAKAVLEQALASMDEGFVLWNADEQVLSWNGRYVEMFPYLRPVMVPGAALRTLARSGADNLLPGSTEEERLAWIEQRVAFHQAGDSEFEQCQPDGRTISTVKRRTATGGVVAVYRDVTRARAAALELERAKLAAVAANEAKSRFLATMSHEIRTPLNGVLGMNGLMLCTPLNATQRRYAETIHSSGEALLGIINDVLDMSRLEAGAMMLEHASFSPADLIDGVVDLLGVRAQGKGVVLTAVPGPEPALRLDGDAGRLRQVLINLVGNAIKFTASGSVTVNTGQAALADGRVEWTVSVRDTGIGIAPETMATLFERFTQADSSTSRRFGGSGLGLAICRQLVDLMGGRIDVDSRAGEGSEFRISVPLAVSAAVPEQPAAQSGAPAPQVRALRVLVAEDNPVNQILLQAMLVQLGHASDLVGDGREALRQIQAADYDLVLMDIQMPDMDGEAAARAIRALATPVAGIPIIAITANVLPAQRAAYLAAGINEHVAKPIALARLQAAIASVMTAAPAPADG